MSAPTAPTLDVAGLSRAIESRDPQAQAAFYTDDAVQRTVDQDHPPSRPTTLEGRDAIAAGLADVCARDMTHEVVHAFQSGDQAALGVACRYSDGTRVLCESTVRLRDGRIAEQTIVQAWDS